LLLNVNTLAGAEDGPAQDDNLLRIMISECFAALVQVCGALAS
jgi:hypothetical protein